MLTLEYEKSIQQRTKNASLTSKDLLWMFLEIALVAISPNIYYDGITIYLNTKFNNHILYFELNYFFFVFLFLRIVRPYVLFLTVTRYFDFRAGRIAAMMGNQINPVFALKCFIAKYPIIFVITNLTLCIVIFAFFILVFEGPIYPIMHKIDPDTTNNLNSYGNCIWFLIVTTTTIGYGDYYPITNLGRIFSVVAAIIGNINISILIYTTQVKFSFDEAEEKVYEFTHRLECKSHIDKVSAIYFKSTVKYILARKELIKFLKNNTTEEVRKNKKLFEKLKSNYYACIYDKVEKKRLFKKVFQ